MMVKSDLEFCMCFFLNSASPFRVAAAQCKNICPERLNWPSSLVSISEGVMLNNLLIKLGFVEKVRVGWEKKYRNASEKKS